MILFHEMLENLSGHSDSLVDRALPRPAERPMGRNGAGRTARWRCRLYAARIIICAVNKGV
jgi:hypothetical protein